MVKYHLGDNLGSNNLWKSVSQKIVQLNIKLLHMPVPDLGPEIAFGKY